MASKAALTHLAFRARDLDASIAFYRKYAGLELIHERVDDQTRVIWLAEAKERPSFVLVMMHGQGNQASPPRAVDHLGFAVESRAQVDALASAAKAEGLLVLGPVEMGPVVGYICEVSDPDGNVCEFSFGQSLDPRR